MEKNDDSAFNGSWKGDLAKGGKLLAFWESIHIHRLPSPIIPPLKALPNSLHFIPFSFPIP
jgi:hypothetical protein